jgi:hypothetical protein
VRRRRKAKDLMTVDSRVAGGEKMSILFFEQRVIKGIKSFNFTICSEFYWLTTVRKYMD